LQAVPTAQPLQGNDPPVGALFEPDANGSHFCTASVVPSPGHNLVMTAAHCVSDGQGQDNTSIVFIPGYSDGIGPYGVWTARTVIVGPQWANGSDPAYDVGFVVLDPDNGKNVQDAVGADQVDFNAPFSQLVRVTGYPEKEDAPVTCENWTSMYSATQLRFTCGGFFAGTSGSPWIVAGRDAAAHASTVVGVIGGYERGGDTSSVSYSVYLGSAIEALYEQAEAASTGKAG
jgi:V8-like Glu-specific endopeptidase